MGYDPYNRMFRPDFGVQAGVPAWVPLDDEEDKDQTPNISPLMEALKKRMGGSAQEMGSGDPSRVMMSGAKAGGALGAMGAAKGGMADGGGMKSL